MTSILFLVETIYSTIFRYNYLRKKNFSWISFLTLSKFTFNFEYFKKKDDPDNCIFELTDSWKGD